MSLQNATNPFVGLRPFESDESLLFFGRQEQTMELLQRLHLHHFVAIIGNSGCGKSSLIRGGLIPRLKAGYLVEERDRWMIAIMKPGQNPLHNLASVLIEQTDNKDAIDDLINKIREEGTDAVLDILKPLWLEKNTNVFLLVDQFEEIFRFSIDQKDAEKKDDAIEFVNIMLGLSGRKDLPIYVVMTMRSDFIGDCAKFFGLPEAMNESQYLVPRLNRNNLKSVIEGPVRLFGSKISPALTSRLLNDADSQNDELPLLQHALMRTWEYEMNVDQNGELDMNDYERIGCIDKALSYHADEALQGMSEKEMLLTKKIFQALTVVDINGRKIRRPVLFSELEAITGENKELLMAIISRFSEKNRSFLIVSKTNDKDDLLVDISHESLIRQWEKLNEWVDEEAESAKVYHRLKESSELHRNKKKDLLEGSEFHLVKQWYETFRPTAIWAKRFDDGFQESIQYLFESDRQQKIRERKKRNRLILIFSSILVSLIIFFLIFQVLENSQRKREAIIKNAFVLNTIAQNNVLSDPTLALRIEEAAYEITPDSGIWKSMHKIYTENVFYKTIHIDSFNIPSLAVAPDGKSFLTGSYGPAAKLWDFKGKLLAEFRGHKDTVQSVAFSPDGTKVLTGSRDFTARLWNLSGDLLQEFNREGEGGRIFSAIFSPDGTRILTGSDDGIARLWSLDGRLLRKYKKHTETIRSLSFSPDGSQFLSASEDKTVILWSLKTGFLKQYRGHKDRVMVVAFSPDGKSFLSGSDDYSARLWNADGTVNELRGHNGPIYSLAFVPPDGERILTAAFDNEAWLWDNRLIVARKYKGHSEVIRSVAFLPGGMQFITASSDSTVRLWERETNLLKEFKEYKDSVITAIFSSDGSKIFAASSDKTAILWGADGSLIKRFQKRSQRITAASFMPDGNTLLIASGSGLELRNLNDSLMRSFNGHIGRINSIAISKDGTKLLSGSDDSTVRMWSMGGSPTQVFNVNGSVRSVAFSQDETKVLMVTNDLMILTLNLDGKMEGRTKLTGKSPAIKDIAFSPDKTKILIANDDRIARLWSINGDLIREFKEYEDSLVSVAFSPDGNKIAIGYGKGYVAGDYQIRYFTIDGYLLSTLSGHRDCILTLRFSPDGTKILSGSEDKTARLWSATSLEYFLKSDRIDKLTDQQKKEYGINK